MVSWLTMVLVVVVVVVQRPVHGLSRRHRDATPFVDDTTGGLFTTDGDEMTVLEGQQPITDACSRHFCERGRVCRVSAGEAVCDCRPFCPRHRKLVCATDGRLYLNHCELHRAACISRRSIRIDRSKACFNTGVSPVTWELPPLDETTQASTDRPHQTTTQPSSLTTHGAPPADASTPSPPSLCTVQKYELFKDNLLLYHHTRLAKAGTAGVERGYLVGLMFSHYNTNNNGHMDREELEEEPAADAVGHLSSSCFLKDLLRYDDTDGDGRLTLNEFYTAFSVSVVSLDKSLTVNEVAARVGDNLELKCDVTGTPTPPIVWRRNGLDLAALNSEDIRVFVDGSLYLTRLQLVHDGNYTCHADRNSDVVQTHVLRVHTVPHVIVTPHIQDLRPGEEAHMSCRATGQPFPKVEWLKNDEPLRVDIPHKYELAGNGSQLRVRNIGFADTGAYMCQASSVGGVARDISSLVVQENPLHRENSLSARFLVFHDMGLAAYEPDACRLLHVVQGTDVIPGTQEYVCGDKGTRCSWGHAVAVADRYIYASQPARDRVLVISVEQMVVVDVIVTDQFPVQLWYVASLDQVWVLNWRSTADEGIKTIQVIRYASQKKKHHTVHPEPIDGHFDLVKDLFIPPTQDLGHAFRYAYVSHTNQRGLYKLDLVNMKYVKTVDLTPYKCVPQGLVYSSLHGLVVVECAEPVTRRRTGQLVLDYLTDAVIAVKPSLLGTPHLTPDSQLVVTVDTRNRVKIVVQKVTEHGLDYLYDVSTTLNVSDVTFFPSRASHSYDLYAASTDKDDILSLDLNTGKVELITGVGHAMSSRLSEWGNTNRPISSAGVFGHYMVSPAEGAIFVLNGDTRTVNCEIGSLVHPRFSLWVAKQGA